MFDGSIIKQKITTFNDIHLLNIINYILTKIPFTIVRYQDSNWKFSQQDEQVLQYFNLQVPPFSLGKNVVDKILKVQRLILITDSDTNFFY